MQNNPTGKVVLVLFGQGKHILNALLLLFFVILLDLFDRILVVFLNGFAVAVFQIFGRLGIFIKFFHKSGESHGVFITFLYFRLTDILCIQFHFQCLARAYQNGQVLPASLDVDIKNFRFVNIESQYKMIARERIFVHHHGLTALHTLHLNHFSFALGKCSAYVGIAGFVFLGFVVTRYYKYAQKGYKQK